VFNSVRHLVLRDIVHLEPIDLNFENVTKLELYYCAFEEISSWSRKNQLKELKIISCSYLFSIPPLDNIARIEINDSNYTGHFKCTSTGNHESFSYLGGLPQESLEAMMQPSFRHGLQCLTLSFMFPEIVDFSFCVDIPVLELSDMSGHENGPAFPVFRGKELVLNNLSLTAWKEEILPNLSIKALF
jgi:hypothetical protein